MSFYRANPFDITPGTAFEAFQAGTRSPMIPQEKYRLAAAGPRYLAGLDGHQYWTTAQRTAIRGLGDPLQDILAAGQPALNQAAGLVLNAMWPSLQTKLDEQLKPIKLFVGITAIAAAAAAAFSFMNWQKMTNPFA